MGKIFTNDNSTQLYMDAFVALENEGDIVAPRGKDIKELRPVIVEFTNPLNRVTFLEDRRINPFFQQAEALWIAAGRSDVEFLLKYNQNMGEFSDDGVFFNAPYGERLRFWNKNDLTGQIINPIDQLVDVYEKLLKDWDTRQAVAQIWNPMFDNSSYEGKDFPCNMTLCFKIRKNKLQLTVYNRSNDLHYGTFGANLCQFATIQEMVASWLGIEVGTYNQVTDSLHIYLKDYGYKESDKIKKAYGLTGDELEAPEVKHFTFENEPRIKSTLQETTAFLDVLFNQGFVETLHNDSAFEQVEVQEQIMTFATAIPDEYFRTNVLSMVAYRAHKLKQFDVMVHALSEMQDCQWKLSCLFFLHKFYTDSELFKELYAHYSADKIRYIEGKRV